MEEPDVYYFEPVISELNYKYKPMDVQILEKEKKRRRQARLDKEAEEFK